MSMLCVPLVFVPQSWKLIGWPSSQAVRSPLVFASVSLEIKDQTPSSRPASARFNPAYSLKVRRASRLDARLRFRCPQCAHRVSLWVDEGPKQDDMRVGGGRLGNGFRRFE